MDKYEYKVRSEEIKTLVEEKNFKEAAEIADTIDWRRVQSVMMLCTVSDVYKMVRRYEDSKAILTLAYDKRPGSRMIIYALTELNIKIGDVVAAWEFYKQFCQIAPDDNRQYVLLYKIYVAQDVSLDEQIKVLETLKEKEYTDRWAYELAYLYHRIGFATKCVEECDEMILWFGEGKYVRKAMELKMLHAQLTPKQQALYSGAKQQEVENGDTKVIPNLDAAITKEVKDLDPSTAATIQIPASDLEEIQVKTMDMSQYNTMNLQQELAKSMAELMDKEERAKVMEGFAGSPMGDHLQAQMQEKEQTDLDTTDLDTADLDTADLVGDNAEELALSPLEDTGEIPAVEEQETTSKQEHDEITRKIMAPMMEETREIPPIPDSEEIFFEDPNTQDMTDALKEIGAAKQQTYDQESNAAAVKRVIVPNTVEQGVSAVHPAAFANQSSGFDDILSQESDGQISLVVPESEMVEKQITGQMSIQDILAEWEILKKEKEQQLADNVKRRVQDQTGDIFAEFDQASKDGLLEHLQKTAQIAEENERLKAELKEVKAASQNAILDDSDEEAEENIETDAETVLDDTEEAAESENPETENQADVEIADENDEESDTTVESSEAADDAAESEKASEITKETEAKNQSRVGDRPLTPEEKELYGSFVQSKKAKVQLLGALDNMSLAPYTGNVLLTGDEDAGIMKFAKNMIRGLQMSDSNFSGRAAKISGAALNKKEVAGIVDKLGNGALIIEAAGAMTCTTAENLVKALQNDTKAIIVILMDTKAAINSLLDVNAVLKDPFNARIDIEALSDDALVAYGKKFAYEKEYAIGDLGALALHTRIADAQTMDHAVTVNEVKQIVKEAIAHANRKTPKHFFDILLGKRYDDEDMIILGEDDFFYNYE